MSLSVLPLLRLPAAGSLLLAAWSGAAVAADVAIVPVQGAGGPVKLELINSSTLGCGEGVALWTVGSGGSQCSFDTATRGARVSALQDIGNGSVEAYATMARTTTGAFTPDRLLLAPEYRSSEETNFFLVGFKGSLLDNRLKVTAEYARTEGVVDELLKRDWARADTSSNSGTSALLRLDATLADRPGLKWWLSGEYRTVSNGYSVGRSTDLFRHFALPGSRLAISSKARIGRLGVVAGFEQSDTPFGHSSSGKAGLDFDGISFRLRSRTSTAEPLEGSSLLASTTKMNSASLDLDSALIASWLLPNVSEMPFLVPTAVNLSYRRGETETLYEGSVDRAARTSLGIDGTWETPIGETNLSYWNETKTGLTDATRSRSSETMQVSHYFRRGHWRFGLDATLSRSSADGVSGYSDRSLSFGQSVAYSAPNGPVFRLQMGQDRGTMRVGDDSYSSADSYSSVTASLDLSAYLQKRFERDDLRLTLDYRKAIDRTESEMGLYDELVERWVDGDRREGILMSFGMKL